MRFWLKKPEVKPIVKMITPGQRAYGEQWREVTIGVDDDKIKVVDNHETEAPPDGRPIYVPTLGEAEVKMVDFLIEGARKSQEYGGRDPRSMSQADFGKWIQQQWLDWCEQKVRWYQGKTTLGAGGFFQREKVNRK